MNIEKEFTSLGFDPRLVKRYVNLIENFSIPSDYEGVVHKHHILPSSLFPRYSSLTNNTWNCKKVTLRQHFILHWVLAKSERNTFKMSTAFFYMCKGGSFYPKSRMYEASLTLYSEKRKFYKHSEETKIKISLGTKKAFKEDPTILSLLSELRKGTKKPEGFGEAIRTRMKENNPMKLESQKERMRGELNVSKRKDVRRKISDGLKALNIQPWEHPRATNESISIWKSADILYLFFVENKLSKIQASQASKIINRRNCTPLYNLCLRISKGWNPLEDIKWQEFKNR